MPALPPHAHYVIIGAGIHGLSTAMHLAQKLKAQGTAVGARGTRIVVLDKTGVGAGASGIACGVVRNNYFQPAMRELMAHCVSVWESDADTYSYHPVGYMQISPEVMHAQVGMIYEQQKAIGYESVFIEGEAASRKYMQGLFHDWQAKNITSVLHEKRGGYANNMASLRGLAAKATALGVEIVDGVTVTALRAGNGSAAITSVETSAGSIACDEVVVGVGPWVNDIWNMLDLPKAIRVQGRDGNLHDGVPMWHYMALQEGTLGVDPNFQKTNAGAMPPVLHVDTDAPLHSDRDGALITDQLWGIYYKPDFHFGGVQGGAMPANVERAADDVRVDPYGPESPEFVVNDNFADMWTSALAHCQKRFEGQHGVYRKEPSGGIGCCTPDNFPVFDRFRDNVYVIADSNHGYKMIGVGDWSRTNCWIGRARCSNRFVLRAMPRASCIRSATARFPGADVAPRRIGNDCGTTRIICGSGSTKPLAISYGSCGTFAHAPKRHEQPERQTSQPIARPPATEITNGQAPDVACGRSDRGRGHARALDRGRGTGQLSVTAGQGHRAVHAGDGDRHPRADARAAYRRRLEVAGRRRQPARR